MSVNYMDKDPDYVKIPDNLIESFDIYVKSGIPPGGFLRAVLENNLKDTVGKADSYNIEIIPIIVRYVYNELPYNCWGSQSIVNDWIEKKGLNYD